MRPLGNSNTTSPGLRPSSALSTIFTHRRPAFVSGCLSASSNTNINEQLLGAVRSGAYLEKVNAVTGHHDGTNARSARQAAAGIPMIGAPPPRVLCVTPLKAVSFLSPDRV